MDNYPKVTSHKKLDFHVFIDTVKKYPEIYDPSHPSFKQQDDKNGAWNKIAQEFNIDVTACRKKFRTLRERYTRELRRSYLEPQTPIRFEFFKQLDFLSPFIKFRSIMFEAPPETGGKVVVSKRENVEDNQNDSMDKNEIVSSIKIINESDEYYEEDVEQDQEEQTYVDETGNGVIYETQFTEVSTNEQGESEVQHLDDEDIIAVTPRISKKRKFDNWNDFDDDENGDKFFAMSIACTIKRLSAINNIKAKVEIFQILEKYADKK